MSSDPGMELVRHVYKRMKIDAEWSTPGNRGFTWWSGDLAQEVTAGPVQKRGKKWSCPVRARARVVRPLQGDPDTWTFLEMLASVASFSGFVRYPERQGPLQLACGLWVTESNLEPMREFFTVAVAHQAADAYIKAQALQTAANAEPDCSEHPQYGRRTEHDGMLGIIQHRLCPSGEKPSYWSVEDFRDLNRFLGRPAGAFVDEGGTIVEFGPYLLQVRTTERHPQLGNGLLLRLMVPQKKQQVEKKLETTSISLL